MRSGGEGGRAGRGAAAGYEALRFLAVDELRALLEKVDAGEVERFAATIAGAHSLFVAGTGRSGLAMRGFAMRLMQLGLTVHVVGDVTTPAIAAGDVLIMGSGSGATPSLFGLAEKARRIGARAALVTTDASSPIGRLADAVVCIPAPTPKGTPAGGPAVPTSRQPMATLFEQALGILLDACVMLLMEKTSRDDREMFARHANLE